MTPNPKTRPRSARFAKALPGFPGRRLTFSYDYLGRRIGKTVESWSGSAWTGAVETRYVYQGWNVVAEMTSAGAVSRHFLWGLDLSGTMAGAGGVGGLLAIQDGSETYLPGYDGNGNVTVLMKASGGVAAAYEYSPFGTLLRSKGSYAASNPFRFSTKWWDAESGLVYYGYRYYSPTSGRWINRDRIQELGGENLYRYVDNAPMDFIDTRGDIPVLLALAGAGAIGGLASQLVSDLVSGNQLNWRNYAVAAVTGAAAGVAIGLTGPAGEFIVTAANNAVTSVIQQGWTDGKVNWVQVGASVGAGAAVAKVKIPLGKLDKVDKAIRTKAFRGSIRNASLRTAGKIGTVSLAGALIPGAADGLATKGSSLIGILYGVGSNGEIMVANGPPFQMAPFPAAVSREGGGISSSDGATGGSASGTDSGSTGGTGSTSGGGSAGSDGDGDGASGPPSGGTGEGTGAPSGTSGGSTGAPPGPTKQEIEAARYAQVVATLAALNVFGICPPPDLITLPTPAL